MSRPPGPRSPLGPMNRSRSPPPRSDPEGVVVRHRPTSVGNGGTPPSVSGAVATTAASGASRSRVARRAKRLLTVPGILVPLTTCRCSAGPDRSRRLRLGGVVRITVCSMRSGKPRAASCSTRSSEPRGTVLGPGRGAHSSASGDASRCWEASPVGPMNHHRALVEPL